MADSSPRPLTREALIAEFADRILDGRYETGSKLPSEREVALTTGLSRPIVREVLRGLEERGLIDIQAGRGAFVRGPRSMDVGRTIDIFARTKGATPRDLVAVRAMLETETAALAAQHGTVEEIETLRRLAAAFDAADNVIARARSDIAFHAMLAKCSHNIIIETMFGAIAPLIFELQLRSLDDLTILAAGAPLHHEVVRGVANRQPAVARAAMLQHVTLAYDLFGPDIDRSLDAIARGKIASLLGKKATLEDVIADALAEGATR